MKTVSYKQFCLKKVKTIKGGGLAVEYTTTEISGNTEEGSVSYENTHNDKNTKFPHRDLTDLFISLKPVVARVMNFSFYREIINRPEFGATTEQSRLLERTYQEIIAKIEISGISVSGLDSNAGCVIMATFLTDVNNNRTAINVPRIKFNSTKFGFEEDLEETCESIKEETFAFLFENKTGEPELFDDIESEEEAPNLFKQTESEESTNEVGDDLPDMTIESDQEKDDEQLEQESNDNEY